MSETHAHPQFSESDAHGHDGESSMGFGSMKTTASEKARRARKLNVIPGGFPAHPGVEIDEEDELEMAIGNLFKAYDLDESGELSRDEFMKIEMRMCFERGEIFKEEVGAATAFSLMDRDRSGTLDYLEFRERQLSAYQSSCQTKEEILDSISIQCKGVLLERVKMGPRYHAGIRQAVRRIFQLYDTSGDGNLSPAEWIAAQKLVALEIMDDFDEGWVDEATFTSMDVNGDGRLDLEEYMEASFSMFEVVKLRSDHLCQILQRVCHSLEKVRYQTGRETLPLTIYVQNDKTPPFRPPHSAWQDEPTEHNFKPGDFNWKAGGTVRLPLNLQTTEEVSSILRLLLDLPSDTWLSVFCAGVDTIKVAAKENLKKRESQQLSSAAVHSSAPASPACLLRGERSGTGNIQSILEWLAKPNACHRLYVKNFRKRPKHLVRQSVTFFEERENVLSKQTGQIMGIDWETQLVGQGRDHPKEVQLTVGDALLIEVPQTDDSGDFRYVSSIYMDSALSLSRPVQQNVAAHPIKGKAKAKKGKKENNDPDRQDLNEQLTFVALRPGRCVMFIDVSWEDQEEKLAAKHSTCAPVNENSIARIGPMEVFIEAPKRSNESRGGNSKKKEAGEIMWWNGDKWTNKKGAAKKKAK